MDRSIKGELIQSLRLLLIRGSGCTIFLAALSVYSFQVNAGCADLAFKVPSESPLIRAQALLAQFPDGLVSNWRSEWEDQFGETDPLNEDIESQFQAYKLRTFKTVRQRSEEILGSGHSKSERLSLLSLASQPLFAAAMAKDFTHGWRLIRKHITTAKSNVESAKLKAGNQTQTTRYDPEVLILAVTLSVEELVRTGQIRAIDAVYPALRVVDASGKTRWIRLIDEVAPGEHLLIENEGLQSQSEFQALLGTGLQPLGPEGLIYEVWEASFYNPISEGMAEYKYNLSSGLSHDLIWHLLPLLDHPENFRLVADSLRQVKSKRLSTNKAAALIEYGLFFTQAQSQKARELIQLAWNRAVGPDRVSYAIPILEERISNQDHARHIDQIFSFWLRNLSKTREARPKDWEQLRQIAFALPLPTRVGGVLTLLGKGASDFRNYAAQQASGHNQRLMPLFSLRPTEIGQYGLIFSFHARFLQIEAERTLGGAMVFDPALYDLWLASIFTSTEVLLAGTKSEGIAATSAQSHAALSRDVALKSSLIIDFFRSTVLSELRERQGALFAEPRP